jgi:hypothetical protein
MMGSSRSDGDGLPPASPLPFEIHITIGMSGLAAHDQLTSRRHVITEPYTKLLRPERKWFSPACVQLSRLRKRAQNALPQSVCAILVTNGWDDEAVKNMESGITPVVDSQ